MENNIQESIDIYHHTLLMIVTHEQKYAGKPRGNAYIKQKILLEKKALYYKNKLTNMGTKVNIVKLTYQKRLPQKEGTTFLKHREVYNMFFTDVSGEVAKTLLLQLQPTAVNIETSPLYPGTEFPVV